MNKTFGKKLKKTTIFLIVMSIFLYNCLKKPTDVSNDKFDEHLYNLRITEIHYDPDSFGVYSGDSLEFIEIKNIGSTLLNLGNLQITEGVNYVFPPESKIEAGEFIVLASNSKAFQERYGFAPDGVYYGQLKNSGEKITIVDVKYNIVVLSQEYADSGAWKNKGKGGYSLVPIDINPEKHPLSPDKWRNSVRLGGSPGKDDIKKEIDPLLYNLRITEINYHPLSVKGIPSDSLEFIEIKNIGSQVVNIGTLEFSAGIKYTFPADAKIEGGGFVVLVSNIEAFKRVYPHISPLGVYTGQLSDKGEKISLADGASGEEILVVDYKDSLPWPELADGKGGSLVPIKSNPDKNQNNPSQWRRSLKINGSPAADDPGIVVINEILTHTDPPLSDAVELYNPGDEPVDIGGWFLTDRKVDPLKFRIPDNTIIPPHGYIYFNETHFNTDS
ncbi:MAG: lamin tail domain-containing protein, partial [Chitinispirillaceae bacterium]|nr:lamin tail domain-containing protein [Chitinispirillaceae bacterium]